MNTNYPHDIVDDIKSVPAAQRKHYRPIKPNDAKKLAAMSPEERGRWLAEHPLDAERVRRAQEKRARKHDRRA